MRFLVVGSGGREHALARKLARRAEVVAAPGNPGIAELGECHPVPANDLRGIAELAARIEPDAVVIGPEDPLIAGLADTLRSAGLAVFGPSARAAELEGSKSFAKRLMAEAGVPTAAGASFTDAGEAEAYVRGRFAAGRQVAVKASGAALGKGVVVAETLDEALATVDAFMRKGDLGDAGRVVVIEDRLLGREFSLLTMVSDGRLLSLPIAQDHKRALDGDLGPNTGGMGTYSPVPWVSQSLLEAAEERVARPIVEHLARQGISYRGVLFSGLMAVDGDPYCLEYNVRFGDPETQSVLPRLADDFCDAILAVARGEEIPPVAILPVCAVTVVLASGGYPGPYEKGVPVEIGPLREGAFAYHAGTARTADGTLVTAGGRVLGVTGTAKTLGEARNLAYEGAAQVSFSGKSFRSDIAADAGFG
ncbi:MAG: phosphoribosylamine--glycine ligase [Fimbriimonadaceae bacterium]|nr:phosphoribosylamine--glycine ligase [Fimbriimonadaceae bacterium]QYK54685.1 MAG: phosphoribosylamine--glycine ligase [Fimbriimonadaceae bacterium]